MFKKTIIILLLIFFFAGVLSACGQEANAEIQEKTFEVDYLGKLDIPYSEQVICSNENTWIITTVKNDYIYKLETASENVGMEKIEWKQSADESLVNIAEQGGTLYAEIYNKAENVLKVRILHGTGAWVDVMSIAAQDDEEWLIVGSGFFVDSSENVYLVNSNRVTRFDKTGNKICEYVLDGNACIFRESVEGYAECIAADTEKAFMYRLYENMAEEKWTLERCTGELHSVMNNDAETLCMVTNTEMLFVDTESGNLTASIDLMKLGIDSVISGYYYAYEGELCLYCTEKRGEDGLSQILLSEIAASDVQRIELIYGMVGGVNADATASIWNAIATFNQENKNYYVTIKNYDNNIERLHADMAAGNGPDIIDMTYVEYYEAYVKNGYLEDLSLYLEASEYNDDIIWNVLDAYMIDGGLYLMVPQFQLSGLLINPEYEAYVENWNMQTFLSLIEINEWNMDIFGNQGNPEELLMYMLCGGQEEFIDWENNKAFFETQEFMDMLKLCMEYSQAPLPDMNEDTNEEQKLNTLFSQCLIGYKFYTYLLDSNVYGREYTIYGYPTGTDQTYGVIACSDSCAIYSGSKNKEGAWEFIESLLWDTNQEYAGITNPGFPIRASVLNKYADKALTEQIRINGIPLTMTENEIMIVENIIYNGKIRRTTINDDIKAVIQEESASYFAGDKSAEETAHIIQSRVQLILNE